MGKINELTPASSSLGRERKGAHNEQLGNREGRSMSASFLGGKMTVANDVFIEGLAALAEQQRIANLIALGDARFVSESVRRQAEDALTEFDAAVGVSRLNKVTARVLGVHK